MVGFAAIEGTLHTLTQVDVVDEVQDIQGAAYIVQLPKGLLGLILGMVQKPRLLLNTRRAEAGPNISRYVG